MKLSQNEEVRLYLESLLPSPYIDSKTLNLFKKRLAEPRPITKIEGQRDHMCTFALPYNRETHSVYLCHHKKAGAWIPPGGHLDPGETLRQTVKRELKEELGFKSDDNKTYFYTITIKHIDPPRSDCIIHYDFWHIVETPRENFIFDKKEFYDAAWVPIEDAYKNAKHPQFMKQMKMLPTFLSHL